MAYREAESARYELRIGMVLAFIGKRQVFYEANCDLRLADYNSDLSEVSQKMSPLAQSVPLKGPSVVASQYLAAQAMVKLVLLALLALSSGLKLSDKQEFDYDHLQSSIVRIQTVGASFDWFRPFNPQDGQVSLGSGFIVQTEPYILIATNQHVINDALRVQVQLLLHSQMKWDVQIVSACPKFDLALLTLKDDQGFKATLRKAHLEVQPLILRPGT
ncbi:unnamed protein product [Cladocopium goreaui]|uniref:Serine protease n=1 Tax=Cladocopium goreaui TaxID=2562237 RepID=A0A9P1CN11_9DINO|nr:unnamed protein product [Cladocopium goreaui]